MSQNQLSGSSTTSTVSTKKSKIALGNHIGTSSILLIFVVLCFVSFAALSLISSNADYVLSKKVADRTKAYYVACNEAGKQMQPGTMTYPISDNQWLQVTIVQDEDIKYISEHRIYTDTDSMDYNQSLPVLQNGNLNE